MNILLRGVNLAVARLCDPPAVRAANPNTTDWGVGRLLRNPTARTAAYNNAFARVHNSPKLALQIMIGDFEWGQKIAVAMKLREQISFPGPFHVEGSKSLPLSIIYGTLPRFLELLSRQPREVVTQVHRLWLAASKSNGPGFMSLAEQSLQEISKGYTVTDRDVSLKISDRASQTLIGYTYLARHKEGTPSDHLYFLSSCVIDGQEFNYTYRRSEPKRRGI
jgi:hypothetical protein